MKPLSQLQRDWEAKVTELEPRLPLVRYQSLLEQLRHSHSQKREGAMRLVLVETCPAETRHSVWAEEAAVRSRYVQAGSEGL